MSIYENQRKSLMNRTHRTIPVAVVLYTAFVLVVSLIGWNLPIDTIARLAPYTSWAPTLGYPIHILVLLYYWIWRDKKALAILVGLLIGQIYIGIYDFVRLYGEDFANPAMRVSAWRIIWTVIVPALWAVVILFSFIKQRRKSALSKNAA